MYTVRWPWGSPVGGHGEKASLTGQGSKAEDDVRDTRNRATVKVSDPPATNTCMPVSLSTPRKQASHARLISHAMQPVLFPSPSVRPSIHRHKQPAHTTTRPHRLIDGIYPPRPIHPGSPAARACTPAAPEPRRVPIGPTRTAPGSSNVSGTSRHVRPAMVR